jgi:hypothetical protein
LPVTRPYSRKRAPASGESLSTASLGMSRRPKTSTFGGSATPVNSCSICSVSGDAGGSPTSARGGATVAVAVAVTAGVDGVAVCSAVSLSAPPHAVSTRSSPRLPHQTPRITNPPCRPRMYPSIECTKRGGLGSRRGVGRTRRRYGRLLERAILPHERGRAAR